jgi:hypothetical protein
LIEDGDPKAALPALMLVAKERPKTTIVQIKLGQALALIGDRQAALVAYRKAGALLPGDETVGNAREAWKYLIGKGLKELGQSETPAKDG